MSLTALREEIGHELRRRMLGLRPDAILDDSHPHRLRDARENLAPGVSYELLRADLIGGGEGAAYGRSRFDELSDIDSSIVLAANTFGRFRSSPGLFRLPGLEGFDVLRLGKRLRTGFGGAPVRLDALAVGEAAILGASCVLTEPLVRKTANLAASCLRAVVESTSAEWSAMYESLCRDPSRFHFLDGAALVLQYLGMRSALADESQPKTLLYVFWEPVDWTGVPAFAVHRQEVLEFSLAVAGADVGFVAMSCSELWDMIEEGPDWPGRAEWLEYLRARYVF